MMRSPRTAMIVGAASMAAAIGLAGLEPRDPVASTPEPGSGRRFRAAPTYHKKHPATPADRERVRLAEAKRARKAERLRAAQASGGIR